MFWAAKWTIFSLNWESGFGTSAEHVETTGFLGTDSYPESPSSDETAKRLGTRLRSYSMNILKSLHIHKKIALPLSRSVRFSAVKKYIYNELFQYWPKYIKLFRLSPVLGEPVRSHKFIQGRAKPAYFTKQTITTAGLLWDKRIVYFDCWCIKPTNMKRIKTHKITKTRHHCWPHTKEEGYNLGWTSRFYIYTRRLQKLSFLSYTNPYSHGQDATAAFRRSWYLAWLTCACLLMKELAIPQNIQDNLTTMKYTFLSLERWNCCFCHF